MMGGWVPIWLPGAVFSKCQIRMLGWAGERDLQGGGHFLENPAINTITVGGQARRHSCSIPPATQCVCGTTWQHHRSPQDLGLLIPPGIFADGAKFRMSRGGDKSGVVTRVLRRRRQGGKKKTMGHDAGSRERGSGFPAASGDGGATATGRGAHRSQKSPRRGKLPKP